jgi:hypothetical protein
MNDYEGWIHRTVDSLRIFQHHWEKSQRCCDRTATNTRRIGTNKNGVKKALPEELCRFWLEGSRCFSCRYIIGTQRLHHMKTMTSCMAAYRS